MRKLDMARSGVALKPESFLLVLLRAGDEQAIEQWYALYSPRLLRFLYSRIGNTQDAEELCQDVFIACLESFPLFQEQSTLWTWMCSIAKHEVLDYYRKKYAKRVVRSIPFVEAIMPEPIKDMHEVTEIVRQALARLSFHEQELLLLKYVDNLSVQSIAQRFGVSFKSVESSLFRARKAFRLAYLYAEQR